MSARLGITTPSVATPRMVACTISTPDTGLGATAPIDPLSALDDDFSGASLDPKWLEFEGDGTIVQSVASGELNLTCNAGASADSFWFNNEQGTLLYQLVDGDFDAIADVRVRNLADSGLPTNGDGNYRIAVLAAHDPDRSTDLDYVHVGLGSTNVSGIRCEWKTTVASTSAYGDVAAPSGAGQIRLLRVGQVFTAFYRASSGDAWTTAQVMDRAAAPLPSTLQLGFGAYSNLASHDIRIFVDRFRVTTPS